MLQMREENILHKLLAYNYFVFLKKQFVEVFLQLSC